jgi:SAM-dependent methyltransferase
MIASKEMMFGLREPFRYRECRRCGCLQLVDVPDDLGKYYPPDYYSLKIAEPLVDRPAAAFVRRVRAEVALRLPESVVERLVAQDRLPELFRWVCGLGLRTTSSIADVGSGGGEILLAFARQGFTNLVGFDRFLDSDHVIAGSIPLLRTDIDSDGKRYDLIMLHHSFEHMPDPRGTLRRLVSCLKPGGRLLIRVPVADSWAFEHYGADWVQLDPPRHLFVHTEASMRILANECGLEVVRSFRDGYGLQFWGSELYQRDIPLRQGSTSPPDRAREVLGEAALSDFDRRAKELNAAGTGDSGGVVLRRRTSYS